MPVRSSIAGGDVAVHDQLHPGARGADLLQQLLVALAVENDDGEVVDVATLGAGDAAQVVGHGIGDVDDFLRPRPDNELLHVVAVGVEERTALCESHGGDAVGKPPGHQPGAVNGVDGNIDLGRAAVADALADVEHRRLILLPLADDDHPVHVDEAETAPHRVHRRLVRLLLLIAPHEPGRCDRRPLGHSDQLERDVAVDRGADVVALPGFTWHGYAGGSSANDLTEPRPPQCQL
jgi:hypothetical protein